MKYQHRRQPPDLVFGCQHRRLYDARGVVDVSYKGILPDLFREGQGVVAQGVLDGERHITAQQVLAKHDENYTPPEVKNAMTPEKTGAQP